MHEVLIKTWNKRLIIEEYLIKFILILKKRYFFEIAIRTKNFNIVERFVAIEIT